jgi:hypothetical protein
MTEKHIFDNPKYVKKNYGNFEAGVNTNRKRSIHSLYKEMLNGKMCTCPFKNQIYAIAISKEKLRVAKKGDLIFFDLYQYIHPCEVDPHDGFCFELIGDELVVITEFRKEFIQLDIDGSVFKRKATPKLIWK